MSTHSGARGAEASYMRRVASVAACLLVLAAFASIHAEAAPTFVASFELGGPPSFQTAAEKTSRGSWVRHSSPVVADLGPEGRAIIVGSQDGKIYALKYAGGKLVKLWDSGTKINTFIESSPAVADLNRDGCPEVLVGAGNEFHPSNSGMHVFDCHGGNHRLWRAPGHSKANHVGVFSTPAIGDVDGDGSLDVAYGSFNEKIYVKDRNGNDLPGWPRENLDTVWSSAALADINGDGKREVIIGTDLGGGAAVFGCAIGIRGTLSVFNHKGEFMPGFPKCTDTPIWSSASVQDVNENGTLDIVVGTNNYLENNKQVGNENKVRAWDSRTGAKIWETTFPSGTRVFASPAVGDVGGDGTLDVAVGTIPASNYGRMYLLDARTGKIRWHKEGGRRDVCTCIFMGSPVMADVDGDGKAELVAASGSGGVNAWDEKGTVVINDLDAPPRPGDEAWKTESDRFFNSPAIADLDKDGDNEMVLASAIRGTNPLRGKVWIVSTTGSGVGPWPMFKKSADRISAVGKGPATAAAPATARAPAPGPVRTSSPSAQSSKTARATPAATSEPTASPSPSAAPLALPPPVERSEGPNIVLLALASILLLSASGLATYAVLRRRRAGRIGVPFRAL